MAVCDRDTLLASAKVYAPYKYTDRQLIIIQLLRELLERLDPMADCTPAALLEEAKCLACLSPGQRELVQAQLLCNIHSLGGVGVVRGVLSGHGPPTEDPTETANGYLYIDLDTKDLYIWDGSSW